MGWASGSRLFGRIIKELKVVIEDKDQRKKIYRTLMSEFQESDWDTEDECLGLDDAYDEMYSEWYKEYYGEEYANY